MAHSLAVSRTRIPQFDLPREQANITQVVFKKSIILSVIKIPEYL